MVIIAKDVKSFTAAVSDARHKYFEKVECLGPKQAQNKGMGVCYTVWLGSMKGMGLRTCASAWIWFLVVWLSSSSTIIPHRNITNILHGCM